MLGHTITLGAEEPIYDPDRYLLYRLAWQQAVDQGALNGYAHFGASIRQGGPDPGLPLLAPHNLMHFMEVLQFNVGNYDTWYDMLNLGFRIAPTAGTDYPCGVGSILPGQERFYTKVDGPFTYKNWLAGVRAGRTFVTTGPMLEFTINGQDIGGEVVLDKAGEVRIKGFIQDPIDNKDNWGRLLELELIENGQVVRRFPRIDDSGTFHFDIRYKVKKTSWLALRTSRSETVFPSWAPNSMAHSAPIYVTLENTPAIETHSHAQAIAKDWLASLESLEHRLSKDNFKYLLKTRYAGDPVPPELLSNNRSGLLEEIKTAKAYFESIIDRDIDKAIRQEQQDTQ